VGKMSCQFGSRTLVRQITDDDVPLLPSSSTRHFLLRPFVLNVGYDCSLNSQVTSPKGSKDRHTLVESPIFPGKAVPIFLVLKNGDCPKLGFGNSEHVSK